jgi:hypothetical protein
MPFTLAHPAAAIPFRRVLGRAGVLSALVIGSLSPDLPYFLPWRIDRAVSHSWLGLLVICVPLGFATYLLFHGLLRPLGYALPPRAIRERLPRIPGSGWLPVDPVWAVAISLAVGAATHICWDGFTHENGFVVEAVPSLRTFLFQVEGHQVYLFRLLQHASSLIGLSLLAYWMWRWIRTTQACHHPEEWQPSPAVRRTSLIVLFASPAIGGLWYGLRQVGDLGGILALRVFAGFGVVAALAIFGAILLGLGVLWRLREGWVRLTKP